MSKIKNPLTGRMINIGGYTYNRLVKNGYIKVEAQLRPAYPPVVTPVITQVGTSSKL